MDEHDTESERWRLSRYAPAETEVDHEKATEALYTDIRQLREKVQTLTNALIQLRPTQGYHGFSIIENALAKVKE